MTVVKYATGYPVADALQRQAELQPAAAWLRVSDQTTNTKRPYWGKARLEAVLTDEVRANLILDFPEVPAMVAVTTRRGYPVILIRTKRGEDLLRIGRTIGKLVRAQAGHLIVEDATKPAKAAIAAGTRR